MTKKNESDWTIPPSLFAIVQNNNESSSDEEEEEEADETSSSSKQDDQPESTALSRRQQNSRGSTASNLVLPSTSSAFPWMLYGMLEDAEQQGFQDIISWLPGGKGFKVYDQVRFVGTITKMCFSQTHYKSFQRQLNLYGFSRITTSGPDKGGYTHEFLVRGEPGKCRFMVRTKNKGMGRTTTKRSLTRVPSTKGATSVLRMTHKNARGAAAAGGGRPSIPHPQRRTTTADEEEEHTSSSTMKTPHCSSYPHPLASSLTCSRRIQGASSTSHCREDVDGTNRRSSSKNSTRRTDKIGLEEGNEKVLLPPALNNTADGQVMAAPISATPLIQPFLSHMQSLLVYKEGNTHTTIPAEIADEIIAIFGTGKLRATAKSIQ